MNRAMKIIHVKSTSSDHEKKISKEIKDVIHTDN